MLAGIRTPKRPQTLPVILSVDEIHSIIAKADNIRDKLLLTLTYACGLKVREVCGIRWADIDLASATVNISGIASRTVSLPQALLMLLGEGQKLCPPQDHVFKGMTKTSHLSERMATLILRQCVLLANINKPVSLMTLRHSFAVHRLKDGINIREVQQTLGHGHVETTLIYNRFISTSDVTSPLDRLKLPTDTVLDASLPSPIPASSFSPSSPISADLANVSSFSSPSPSAFSVPSVRDLSNPDVGPLVSSFNLLVSSFSALSQPMTPIESVKLYYKTLKLSLRRRFLCLRC